MLVRAWEYAFAIQRALQTIDRQRKIDIVEVTEGTQLSLLANRWPVVLRAHGSDWTFRYFCQEPQHPADYYLIQQQSRQMRSATSVVALSKHLADHLSEFCHFPRKKIQVLPYPIDLQEFYPHSQAGAEKHIPILLSVGRLERRKGADTLIETCNLLWRRYPTLRLFLLGSEADLTKAELLARVPEEKRQQIIFPGFVSRGDIPEYYRRATLYVAPTCYETFGYTILEAMASGLPVVACNVGAVPELVQPNNTGSLVSPRHPDELAQAIIALLADQETCRQMGQAGRQRAQDFALEVVMDSLINIYAKAYTNDR